MSSSRQRDSSNEKKQFYSFKIVSYASWEELEGLRNSAKHWCAICHDSDDGMDKHFHILATFAQRKSFAAVRRLVVSEQNTLCQPLEDWIGDFEYLTHKNAPEKHQYTDEEVLSDDLAFWKRKAKEADAGEDDFVNDLLSGQLTYRQMAVKYGRDYMRNFRAYEAFALAVQHQEVILAQKTCDEDFL